MRVYIETCYSCILDCEVPGDLQTQRSAPIVIKWHRRCKSLEFLVNKYKSSITFCGFLQEKFRVGTFEQGRSGNSKQTYFFGRRHVTNKFIISLK